MHVVYFVFKYEISREAEGSYAGYVNVPCFLMIHKL